MKYIHILNDSHSGSFNMDFDIALAEHCREDEFYFRLYRWEPFCLSLGANQNSSLINSEALAQAGIDIVNRPSGGKAILHAEELTYSVVCHTNATFTPQQIYKQVNEAILLGLSYYDTRLATAEMEAQQHDFRQSFNLDSNFACFGSSAKNELKFAHKKLVGSAQRKMGNVILQHGSILCGAFHKRITEFLRSDAATIDLIKNDLEEKTTEIETILNEPVDYLRLENSLLLGFEKYFSVQFQAVTTNAYFDNLHLNEA